MGVFKIDVEELSWINEEKDDKEDLCLHGNAIVIVGKRKLEYHATVSATALYLLKTLTEEHIINEDNQMLPCCGFFYIPNSDLTEVSIIGCDNGIDWTVLHEDNRVKIILENGEETIVDLEEYRLEVFRFVDKIEDFYKKCSPKKLSKDKFESDGYIAFWNEWHRRRGK